MRDLRLFPTIATALTLLAAPLPALAASLDGDYSGASSIAGGPGECWGNNPAVASVSGSTVTIRYVAYDGSQAPITATLRPDGSFTASQPIKTGTISYSGKVTTKRLTATWKGPTCYGTLDMSK
jgi:hypothetical protein